MASSYTGLGTELMTTGENAGNWGTKTNVNLQIIEQLAGGYIEQAVTSTPTTLSVSDGSAGAELAHRIIKFTGTISENTVVTIPLDVQQMYVLVNGTSGSYTVQFKYVTGSGSSVTFSATDKGTKIVYATADDGTDPNIVDTGIASHQINNTITVGVDDTGYDVKFFGATASAYMLWDESADDLVLAGAAGIDLAGDIDVDGTANLDAVDIDGAVQLDSTLTVGANDQGYDIKFFGDTASAYMLWDTSADDLILAGGAGLVIPDAGNIGSASDTDAVAISSAGVVALSATTEASATGTAALTLAGGLGVAKDVWIGDDLVLDSDSTVLKFGDDQDTTLTHTDGTGLTLNLTNKLCFYDTALSIHSSTDGQLDLIADTEIQIAATTIDINGAVAMDGAITGATDITLSGELDAATLDISSNADIDGTTNLDAVDIDGAVQIDATFTSGVDGQGYDTKFFGDTASAYMLWDTSADDLVFGEQQELI